MLDGKLGTYLVDQSGEDILLPSGVSAIISERFSRMAAGACLTKMCSARLSAAVPMTYPDHLRAAVAAEHHTTITSLTRR